MRTLINACKTGSYIEIEKILKSTDPGVDINCVDKEGNDALMWAARKGHSKAINLLRKFVSDNPTITYDVKNNKYGHDALTHAAMYGHAESVMASLSTMILL